jgi:hypothetical protein
MAKFKVATKVNEPILFMKRSITHAWLALAVASAALTSIAALGAESTNTTITQPSPAPAAPTGLPPDEAVTSPGTTAPTANAPAPVHLPYGVEDVLKLSRAKISEDIILNYVQNSGTIYNLSSQDIVYLRNEGVSDNTLKAMLDNRKRVEAASQASLAAASAAQATAPATIAPNPTDNGNAPTTYADTGAASTTSGGVIPYGPVEAAYYGAYRPYGYYDPGYPYYYGYGGYGWGGPVVSFGFAGPPPFPGHGPGFGPVRPFGGPPVPGRGGPVPGRGFGGGRGAPGGHPSGVHHH